MVMTGILCALMLWIDCQRTELVVQGPTSPMTNTEMIKRIALVDEVHAETMMENPTDFKVESLPFYKKFKLLRVTVDLPHRPLQFRYADDGSRLIILDATPEHIYEINKLEDFELDRAHLVSYLRFFLANSGGDPMQIVETGREVNWLQLSSEDSERKALEDKGISLIHAARMTPLPDNAGFFANATGIRGRKLVEISVTVRTKGHVEIMGERVLVPDLPVAQVAW
jgi:hypothetical protein